MSKLPHCPLPDPPLEHWPSLAVAPAQVVRGTDILAAVGPAIAQLGQRPFIIGGFHGLEVVAIAINPRLTRPGPSNR